MFQRQGLTFRSQQRFTASCSAHCADGCQRILEPNDDKWVGDNHIALHASHGFIAFLPERIRLEYEGQSSVIRKLHNLPG